MGYFYNILVVIWISLWNIIGTILVGRLPKSSPYHWLKTKSDDLSILNPEYWIDEDLPLTWKSKNELLKATNRSEINNEIESMLSYSTFDNLNTLEKNRANEYIYQLVCRFNRKII